MPSMRNATSRPVHCVPGDERSVLTMAERPGTSLCQKASGMLCSGEESPSMSATSEHNGQSDATELTGLSLSDLLRARMSEAGDGESESDVQPSAWGT
jgi:hypothetical protein